MRKQLARRSKRFAWLALSIVVLVAAWQVAAYVSDPRLLPGPGRVGATLVEAGLKAPSSPISALRWRGYSRASSWR